MKDPRLRRAASGTQNGCLTLSIIAVGILLLLLNNNWVNAVSWAYSAEAKLHDTVQIITSSRSLLRSDAVLSGADDPSKRLDFGPPSTANAWKCPATDAVSSRRLGLNPKKYLLLGQINEQLTKSTRHLGEYMILARELNRTLVLPDVGESEIGMQRSNPFCIYFDLNRLGEFVDWVTPDQFIYETRALTNQELTRGTVREFLSDVRSKAVRFAFDVEWQRPKELALGEYDWLEEAVLETDRLLGPEKPSAGALVLKRVNEFCGLRVKPFLWFRLSQLVELDTVICMKEPQFGAPGALNRSLENIVKEARTHLEDLDVVIGVKNRAYNLFLPKDAVKHALTYLRPASQIAGNAARLKAWLGPRYVAVQWRIEKCLERDECDEGVLQKCTQGLVSTVKKRLAALGATRVFFASDAPSPDGTFRSYSYMALKDPERKIKMAQSAAAHVLSNLEAVTWEMFDSTVLGLDSGIQAMLDKIVCTDAEAFVVAPDECIGTPSEFAISIEKARKEVRKVPVSERWKFESEETER